MTLALPSRRLAPVWVRNDLWRRARAVPSLDLRFASSRSLVDATTGQNLVTFSRASEGTFVNSQGVIQTAAINAPRFDHNPTTGESLGLLVEEQRTNLLLRSEEFDNGSWSKNNASITADSIAAPNGTASADSLIENSASSEHSASQAFTAVSGTAYTFSVFVKSLSGNRAVKLRFTTTAWTGSINTQVDFNLTTGAGTVITGSPTFTSQAFSGGWWRFSMTTTSTANGTPGASIHLIESVGSVISYTGDGTSGIYIWGAQLEAAAFPTSYIPTTTAAATRSADVASITGTAFSSWYRQDEGTVFGSYIGVPNITGGGTRRLVEIGGSGVTSNRMIVGYNSTGGSRFLVVSGGSTQADINPIATQGTPINTAAAYAVNNFQQGVNGSLGTADTSGSVPTVAAMQLGNDFALTSGTALNGTIRRLTYFPQRLGNEVLQRITQ